MRLCFQWKGRRRGRALIFIVFVTSVVLIFSYFLLSPQDPARFTAQQDTLSFPSGKSVGSVTGKSYVVNTSTCKIPDLNPWDEDILMLNKKCDPINDEIDPKCGEKPIRKWMYAQGSNLVLNRSAIKEAGYSLSSIRCCYHVISRVEQSLEKYDMNADVDLKYSKSCHPIPLQDTYTVEEEFVRVFCLSNSWPFFNDIVYREFFAFAQPDSHAQKKIGKWKSFPPDTGEIPPSIVILGLDTNSRLNSHRRLNQTLRALEEMGAIEFFGYTKVGENTFPNTVAFLAGMTEPEIQALCYKTVSVSLDNCPLIWKDFDRAGYLTSTSEDGPQASGFNFMRAGFVFKPTDFYIRPFTLAWSKVAHGSSWFERCVGRYLPPEMVLNYLQDILHRGSSGAPVFIHSWFTSVSHHCINSVRFEDPAFHRFITSVDKRNTILVFMSDHGDRHGPFRETTLGWYEDKLPAMWIYLPDAVRNRFPDWESALRLNSRRLTSHFDLYHTLVQILNAYKKDPSFQVNTPENKIGQSLLEPVQENRTCESIGVPSSYCACTEPEPIDIKSTDVGVQSILSNVTNAAISYLTKILPKECATPTVKKLVSGKILLSQTSSEIYIVSFYADPGDFLYEVTVKARKMSDNDGEVDGERDDDRKTFSVESLNDILRMNKITRKVNCVTSPVLERYCYCL